MLAEPIKVLLIEDNPGDKLLIKTMLSDFNEIILDATDTLQKGLELIAIENYDAILLDLGLPDSSGVNTLISVLVKYPDYPLIVLTGQDESELGILAVQAGAQDFFNKNNLSGNLIVHSLYYAIERQKLIVRLKQNANEIKRLQGLLPICMNCKKIRDDKGYWEQIEKYLAERSSVTFSHGLCPACFNKACESM